MPVIERRRVIDTTPWPMRPYWRVRHWLWARAERRFVTEVVRRLGDLDRLYVHPVEGGPATILITPYDPLPDYNHNHVEGPPDAR